MRLQVGFISISAFLQHGNYLALLAMLSDALRAGFMLHKLLASKFLEFKFFSRDLMFACADGGVTVGPGFAVFAAGPLRFILFATRARGMPAGIKADIVRWFLDFIEGFTAAAAFLFQLPWVAV